MKWSIFHSRGAVILEITLVSQKIGVANIRKVHTSKGNNISFKKIYNVKVFFKSSISSSDQYFGPVLCEKRQYRFKKRQTIN